jgi:Tol biopolymer transport system component
MRFSNLAVLAAVAIVGVMLAFAERTPQQTDPEVLLRAAIESEEVDGDLEAAIETYKQITASAGSNRGLAATALLRLGGCYEKLGRDEARKAFESVVNDYSDQLEQADAARKRLSRITQQQKVTSPSGSVLRQVWADDPLVDSTGSISPDGRYLAFTNWSSMNVAVRDLSSGRNHEINNSDAPGWGRHSAFSPDSRQLAFVWFADEGDQIRVVSVDEIPRNGTPKVLFSSEDFSISRIRWSSDGRRLLAATRGLDKTAQLKFIDLSSGSVSTLKSLGRGSNYDRGLSISPDSSLIVYDFPQDPERRERDISILAADGSRETTLIRHEADDRLIGWTPDGASLLFVSNRGGSNGVWQVDVKDGRSTGSPRLIQRGIGNINPIGITDEGTLFYGTNKGLSDIFISEIEAGELKGEPRRVPSRTEGSNSQVAWSPDGKRIAYISGPKRDFRGHLVIQELATGKEKELNTGRLDFFTQARVSWSPDGMSIVAAGSEPGSDYAIFVVEVGTGKANPLIEPPPESHGVWPIGWAPDGREFLYRLNHFIGEEETYHRSIMAKNLQTNEVRKIVSFQGTSIADAAISPDGKQLALWHAIEDDRGELVVAPSSGGEPRALTELEAGDWDWYGIGWHPTSDEIYFPRGPENGLRELLRIAASGGQSKKTGIKFESIRSVVFHPSGKRLAFQGSETKNEIWVMENFLSSSR